MRHTHKSQLISALSLAFLNDIEDDTISTFSSVSCLPAERRNLSYYYDYIIRRYFSVMIDIMNHVWNRGTDGTRGNNMFGVIVLQIKQVLRPWFRGKRGEDLKQVHLHVDDQTNVILQKGREQERRDSTSDMTGGIKLSGEEELHKTGFLHPIAVSWGTLLRLRVSRDAMFSLHRFC